jgi:hypothetical protein
MEKPRKNNYQKYISKAIELHQGEYDYSKVALEIFNDRTKVEIVCPRHGSFFQELRHLSSQGRPSCSRDPKKWEEDYREILKYAK